MTEKTLYCSFCGMSQHEVRKLIAGPTVFICDLCVELCMDIIQGDQIPADGEAEYVSWFRPIPPVAQPSVPQPPLDDHPWLIKMREKFRARGLDAEQVEAEIDRMAERFPFLRERWHAPK